MKKLYIDNTKPRNGVVGVFIRDTEIIYTGTAVNSEPRRYRENELVKWAEKNEVRFFFDGEETGVSLYTVPFTEAFATDEDGGYFVKSCGQIVYIDRDKRTYKLSDSFEGFMKNLADWRERLTEDESVFAFSSREEAEKRFEIIDLDEMINGEYA